MFDAAGAKVCSNSRLGQLFLFLPLYFGLFPPEGSWWVLTALVLRSVCVGVSLPSVVLHWGDCCH